MRIAASHLGLFAATGVFAFASLAAGDPPSVRADAGATSAAPVADVSNVSDQPLDAYRVDLLQVAFEACSAMPLQPHIRNRSRAQDVVVQACFTLDQPQRALGYIEEIDNWLRGSGYADYALYCARHAAPADVERYLGMAVSMVQREEDWRRDVVKTKAAQAYVWLGEQDKAAALEVGVVDSEVGKANAARALLTNDTGFDTLMARLSADAQSGNFDAIRNAANAYLLLIDRFYADQARRTLVESRLRTAWDQLPTQVRVGLMSALAKAAIDHQDNAGALTIIAEAQATIDGRQWLPADRLPMEARLAGLRWQAGDKERARRDLDALLASFVAQRARITDIDRAETLCPIAEAYHAMGDNAAALGAYRTAIEEGIVNVNSRPRADDLVGTCCSMAVCGVEPDADLWKRIREIRAGLGDPW